MQAFEGVAWRMITAGADPLGPATAPVGRFHHAGQIALYTSLTVEGTVVAMQRYLRPDDPPREVVPLTIRATRLADLRGNPEASVVWQDMHAAGAASPTWAFSDRARQAGAEGMLYSSRSRPDLTHLVLFDLTVIREVGLSQALDLDQPH
ncbi:MAG: RES family NAD+ phosphorylase [Rhodobacterales bacterium]|nr:RES family NAD+ phosphorylase [Rhodobacterales bacterium]